MTETQPRTTAGSGREPMTASVALRQDARKNRWWTLGGHLGLVIVLILLFVVATIGSDAFLTVPNLVNVLRQVTIIAVIAAGLTVLMVSGGIDFSLGSNAGVTACLVAVLIDGGMPVAGAAVVGLITATAIGALNGIVVTVFGVAPFVVTLAMATLLDGFALVVINGMSVSGGPELSAFGGGALFGVPYLLITAGLVCVVLGVGMRYTAFGRSVFAIGGNPETARLSGIPVIRNKLVLYSLMGLLGGVAGVMLLSRLGAASPGIGGLTLELQAVAAVVIGGTALMGGRGTMIGTVIGVILLGVVANALNLLGVSSYFQQMSVGAVLLIAAIANAWQWHRRRSS
jgi:ribose transport system permease protein